MSRVSNYSHSLLLRSVFSFVSSIFRAGQALGMLKVHILEPQEKENTAFQHCSSLLKTKSCFFSPLGGDLLLYPPSPLWFHALVGVPQFQGLQGIFDPCSLLLPRTSLAIQKCSKDERSGDERAAESLIPKKRWGSAKASECSHHCRHKL